MDHLPPWSPGGKGKKRVGIEAKASWSGFMTLGLQGALLAEAHLQQWDLEEQESVGTCLARAPKTGQTALPPSASRPKNYKNRPPVLSPLPTGAAGCAAEPGELAPGHPQESHFPPPRASAAHPALPAPGENRPLSFLLLFPFQVPLKEGGVSGSPLHPLSSSPDMAQACFHSLNTPLARSP